MARYESAVLHCSINGADVEVRFGKNDKVVALPIAPDGFEGWHYVSRDGDVFSAPLTDFPPDILRALAAHGQKQKEKDSVAQIGDPSDMMARIRLLHNQLAEGTFNRAGGGGFAIDPLLVEVLADLTKRPQAEVREDLKGLSKDERDALRLCAEVKPLYDARLSQRTKADPKVLLAKLGVNIVG